ncbi:MAG: GNAT family N-acetyltransferase [Candidatus Eremiobacteraeota bacterium]|nr:GNAT family N-acetyltransferase [Candidatus Eremiobacteraeota bacterium]
MDWIRDLAVQASIHTFSGLRATAQEKAQYIAVGFEELKRYALQGAYRFLIAIDKEMDNERVGYLFLNLYDQDDLGRRQTFVEDIAALPEYWGLGVGHILFDAATKVTAELGMHFMGGEVAAENSRIEAALRNNFYLETYRVVRPCTPEAEQLMEEVRQSKEKAGEVQDKLSKLRERRQRRKRNRT